MNKLMEKVRKNKKAFTLVELVIVILIIAILAAVLIPQLSAMINKSKTAGVNEKFHEYQTAVMSVAVASEDSDNMATLSDPADGKFTAKINEYLDDANQIKAEDGTVVDDDAGDTKVGAKDPWGNEYQVAYFKDTTAASAGNGVNKVTITSLGPDGDAGNDDLTTTISWADGSYHVQTSGLAFDAK